MSIDTSKDSDDYGISSVMDKVLSGRQYGNVGAEPCAKHPGHEGGWRCSECAAEQEAAERERDRLHAIQKTKDACDARFPARYRCAVATHPDVLAWVEAAAKSRSQAGGLLLLGATGTGKTHQAYGALRALLPQTVELVEQSGYVGSWYPDDWRATTYADLNASMRPSNGNDPEATLKANRDTHILMIDDLAAARSSEWVEEHLYRLINGRYEAMRPTIFTTNLSPSDLREAVGDRIASRLAESCTRIVLDGPDLRRTGLVQPEICPAHGVAHEARKSGSGDPYPTPMPEPPRAKSYWEN